MSRYVTTLRPVAFSSVLKASFASALQPDVYKSWLVAGARVLQSTGTRWADLTGNTWSFYSGQTFRQL